MSRGPVRLLVSVRSAAEAESALRGAADVIDIKEPARGPLGAADLSTMASIVRVVADRAPLSAALGELVQPSPSAMPAGLRYAKIGLAGAPPNWPQQLQTAFARAAPAQAIAVAYADHQLAKAPRVHDVLTWACDFGAAGLLVDTATKDGRTLFDWIETRDLQPLIDRAHQHRLLIALAGSLGAGQLSQAMDLEPDIIAVRSAACAGRDRRREIAEERVRALADLIEAHNASAVRRGD